MVHTRLPLSHLWHLSICSTVAPRFVSQFGRNRWRRDSFRHVACFLRRPKNSKSLGPMLQIGPVTGYSAATWSLWGILPTFHISRHDLELCGPLHKRLAVKLFVSDVDVKQSVASWLQTIDFYFFCSFVRRWDICFKLNINVNYMEVWQASKTFRFQKYPLSNSSLFHYCLFQDLWIY